METPASCSRSRARRLRAAATKRKLWNQMHLATEPFYPASFHVEMHHQVAASLLGIFSVCHCIQNMLQQHIANSGQTSYNIQQTFATPTAVQEAGVEDSTLSAEVKSGAEHGRDDVSTLVQETGAQDSSSASGQNFLMTADPNQSHHISDEEVEYVEKVKHSTAKLLTAAVQSSSKEDTWEPLLQKLKESASVQKAASYSGQSTMRFMHGVLKDIACDMDGGVFESGG
eukprot:TRINITY_DN1769_c1_g1_i2.p1 TRINITY_DN1769_c1_g1~~TRINITY_DN1769_c1_g1_i2.p1  ORF type:complete len:228 (-),score=50.83 TRINITY_DN1769_c1_g1_i2:214-897(-)